MAFIRGSNSGFKLNSVDLSEFINSFSMSREAQNIDITSLSDTYQENQQNLKGATITISGFYDDGSSSTPDSVIAAMIAADTNAAFKVLYGPASASGRMYEGSCRVASYEVTAAVDNLMAFSCTLNVTTAVTIAAGTGF